MPNMTITPFAEKSALLDAQGHPIVDEIASVAKDELFRGFIGDRLLNPDVVLSSESRGQGLAFYEPLERDCHVSGVLQKRKLAVIGKEWEVLPASEDPRDQEIADFVRTVFKTLGNQQRTDSAAAPKSGFDQARLDLLDAIMKGFSVGELLWAIRPDGRIGIDELKGRDPRRFVFDVENRLRLLTLKSAVDGEELPARKFVVLTFRKKYDNPYGAGLGQQLWWPVWFKKHGIKFWATFMEKFGMPTAVGKYPSGTQKAAQDALLGALRALQQETAIKIPEGMTIELLEAQRQGSLNTYGDFTALMNAEISKAVLGETLTTEIGQTGGAYAASNTHNDVRTELVKADADLLCEAINTQVIPPLVAYNYAGVTAYPACWIRCEEEEDLTQLATRDRVLAKDLGLPIGRKYFYDTYGVPEPQGDEALVAPPTQQPSALGAQPPVGAVDSYRLVEMQEAILRIEGRLNAS